MKKLLSAVFAVAVAALFIVPSAVQAGEKTKKEAAPKDHQLTGEISAVDVAANTVTLKTKKDGDKVFTLAPDVKFGGEGKGGIANLKVGDKVVVHYTAEGDKLTASRIGHADTTVPMKKKKDAAAPAAPAAP